MKRLINALCLRLKWLCYSLFMLCCRVFPLNNNKVLFVNYYGKGYGDNAKYICEYLRSCSHDLDLVWAALNEKDFFPGDVRTVRYLSVRYFYELSTAKVWVDNCRKPSYIKKRKNQYYIQTWHGDIGPKRVEGEAINDLYSSYVKAAKKDSKMADLFVTGNEAFAKRYRTAFWYDGEIIKCGYPRRDIFFNLSAQKIIEIKKKIGINEDQNVVLYAPTFRSGSVDLSVYKVDWERVTHSLHKKFGKEWIVLVRLHPNISQFSSELNLPSCAINVTDYPDMQELLAISNVCISDYSSSVFEFAVMKKPGFIFATDYEKYRNSRDTMIRLDQFIFPFAENIEQLIKCIENFDDTKYQIGINNFLYNEIGYHEDGKASETLGKIIASKCQ